MDLEQHRPLLSNWNANRCIALEGMWCHSSNCKQVCLKMPVALLVPICHYHERHLLFRDHCIKYQAVEWEQDREVGPNCEKMAK